LALGDGAGEGEAGAALDFGDGDGILADAARAGPVVIDKGDGAALIGGIDDLEEGVGDGDVLFVFANHLGALAHDGSGIDHQPLVALGPAVHFFFKRSPVVVVEFGVLGAHVGHVETLCHRCFVPAHVHRRCHVATAVAAAAVFPVLGACLHAFVSGIVVALAVLVPGGIGHIDHRGRQFVGHAVGNPARRIVVNPDGFVVQHLVGHPLGGAHRQKVICARLVDRCSCCLADSGNACQGSYTGLAGLLGRRRKILRLYRAAGFLLVLLFVLLGLFLAFGMDTPLGGDSVIAHHLWWQGTAHYHR